MQFEFDDEQLALQESVRRFLTERYDFETRRGCLAKPAGSSDEIWQAFAEQGFLSIGLPEAHGGIGGATELMLTMEEIGRALVLEPYLSTVALCAPLDRGPRHRGAAGRPAAARRGRWFEARARARRGRGAVRVDRAHRGAAAPAIRTCSTAQRPPCPTAPWPTCCS